ncbi:MAG: ribonuclease P protein component [Gammaproteobacteria bacterium]|nr:ribonuclease P protein component [Gammaproteobacteria bacterium]NNF60121.1 ribonuclease P protein component [Gammaproteobacteria bacterium]NNM21533.1 ribonuclease P protein component [Gammaproteobacteria bacterium]
MRLATREDFDRVFKNCSSRSTDALFTVLALPNDHTYPRLGLAVSKKAAGNAVRRHRLKRRVRESFRLNQHALPGTDIVVIARPGVSRHDGQKVASSLAAHWNRISEKCAPSASS